MPDAVPLSGTGGGSAAVRVSLAGTAQAPAAARQFVRKALADWEVPRAPSDDVTLLVSELVTNAVVHAGTSVLLECRYEDGTLVVQAADRHPGRAVETRAAAAEADGGREMHQGHGLRLLAALAEEWGVTYRRDGKTVWFRMPCGPGAGGDVAAG
ncbi:ATP-binding protein, partial [Streptomyces nanshensis]|uniref:ATP-binding protein n=1 Tax=Streptomyces nanshensis TaxID=518642 RepID=UPI001FD1ADD2